MKKFISNYEYACAKLGRSTELPDVSKETPKMAKRKIAEHKRDVILEANNDGWEADTANTGQKKWYPYFRVIKDKSKPAGFRLAFDDASCLLDLAFLGARPACQSEELAIFMGTECIEIYEEALA